MKHYMQEAIKLAREAEGKTSPNPLVGCVIVKSRRIIGRGYHKKAGLPHAEIISLRQAGRRARGADLYVTLEPCSHYGRTGPCTKAIIASGVKRVVCAMIDPNPLNRGKGIKLLRRAGIKVEVGSGNKEAQELNAAFIKYITQKLPYVTVKVAQSLDGKIATRTGESRWISNSKSRQLVKKLRAAQDAIMVGVNTVIQDNPRLLGKRGLVRVIVDSKLKVSLSARVFSSGAPTIVATTRAPKNKIKRLADKGIEVIITPPLRGRVDLKKLLRELAKREIVTLLVEGGGELIASLLKDKLVDQLSIFIAPKVIGGRSAPTAVDGEGIARISRSLKLKSMNPRLIGADILIEAKV